MQIKALITILCIFSSTFIFASPLKDSVGIENNNGKEVVIHKIETKETYYSLSRKYSIPFKIIMDFNQSVALQPGKMVKIPTERPFTGLSRENLAISTPSLTEYKVKPKETLYTIARRFNTTIDEIKKLNALKSNSLSIGQLLKIPGIEAKMQETSPPPVQKPIVNTAAEPAESLKNTGTPDSTVSEAETKQKNRYGLFEHEERGVAVWIADENLDGSKMLALHRTAPVGTIIKVTNPMNGKSTLVKVVGKFTENETTKDVIIVLTRAVADLVGILDKRFQVSIVYRLTDEH